MLKNYFLAISISFALIIGIVGCNSVSKTADSLESSEPSKATTSEEYIYNDKITEVTIPYPLELYFSSGVGGWRTAITINNDGSFSGNFHDSDMGITGEGYPNGTVSECKFEGKFTNIYQISNYAFSLTLESITTDNEQGHTYIKDGTLYETTYPYGLVNINESGENKEFILYTPEAPIDKLPEMFLTWWPLRSNEEPLEKLSLYGLLNKKDEYGFFTNPYLQE